MPDADEIKKKLANLRGRIEKTQQSIEAFRDKLPGNQAKRKTRKIAGKGKK
jgi:hypothetical protein